MCTLKCCKIGNYLGLILPTHIVSEMQISQASTFSAVIVEGALVVRPIPNYAKDFFDRSKGLMDNLDEALKVLNDN